jgi:mRNA (guanine-N7-)-methyltransferase
MNRTRFSHPEYPIFADLSIVKMSKKMNNITIPKYTIQEADVFNSFEIYEVELEVDNTRIGTGTNYNTAKRLTDAIRKCIRVVLSGLQESNYPISYTERKEVLQSYLKLLHGPKYNVSRPVYPKDFIGPGSYTLQMENIAESAEGSTVPTIRKSYTVTEKADGDRKLLYISEEDGKIYLIDTNMQVIFTGAKTKEKTIYNSLVDGEHIKYNKKGEHIHLYAAFDVYYIHGKSVREYGFIPEAETDPDTKYRLPLLNKLVELMKPASVLAKTPDNADAGKSGMLRVQCKIFESDSETKTIFDGCSRIQSNIRDGLYEYNTDGLIFTPSYYPAGGNSITGSPGPLTKHTWEHSFKWKPVEYNTIDFLVSVQKNKLGKEEIHHIFQGGRDTQGVQDVVQYKTIELRCGFDERKHGYLNPCQSILMGEISSTKNMDDEGTYKPVRFQPTNPSDESAHLCNMILQQEGSRLHMMTEEGEYFEDDMIVEFKYIIENQVGWRWVPIRVRYDKTAELRAGLKNYGNAYHVANNNWHSIHYPITEEIISSGRNIPEQVNSNEGVYYNRTTDETSTRSLRDFHNLYVKSKLIGAVAKRGDTLIDYAVGKAGDMSKWIYANVGFVFGIDVSKDNIHNQLDGACARYLNSKGKYTKMLDALFVVGDSGLNIRSGHAFQTEKEKQIVNAVFGTGPKDATVLGKGVYKHYGVADTGFQVSSCQFAMHYFFENTKSVHSFLRNITECTKVGGYYIGTCYDGRTIFNTLYNKEKEDSITINKAGRKIYEITKMYDQTGFPDDELSVGYAINVFQESINKVFREYLVNFNYLVQLMEDYGFILITKEEANQMHLPDSTGMFNDLFTMMENEAKMHPKLASNYRQALYMTPEEQRISYMNRYFIFKKVRNVDAKKMEEVILNKRNKIEVEEVAPTKEVEQLTVPKKTGRRLVLKSFTPINA